ncbi:hypothetical protein NN561_011987 [Cricetulus griseus]
MGRTSLANLLPCTDHWCYVTLSNDVEWNQKQPLTSMGLQMDTGIILGLGVHIPPSNSEPGPLMDAEQPLGLLTCRSSPQNSVPEHRHCCQMTLNSDDEWEQKQPLDSLCRKMDAELPLDFDV